MTDKAISPLRQRMIEDMTIRKMPVLPIVMVRSSLPTLSIASAKRVQRTSDTHRQRRNPHSV